MDLLTFREPNLSERPIAVPCVRIALYLRPNGGADPARVGEEVARFISLLPTDALNARIRVEDDEEIEPEARVVFDPFTTDDVEALVKEYRTAFKSGATRHMVSLVSGSDYGTTGFALTSFLADPPDPVFKDWRNFIHFDVAPDFVRPDADRLISFAQSLVQAFPECSMTGSAALSFSTGVTPIIRADLNARLMRFVALDPCYEAINYDIGSNVPFAAWLTYLNGEQIEALGGRQQIDENLPPHALSPTVDGILLRASYLPPFADVNRGARDVGFLPIFDKLLQPVLLRDPSKVRNFPPDMADRWFERFANVSPGAWDNGDLVAY